MKLFIHGSLSLNLCNPIIPRYLWSLENLMYDLNFGHKIGAEGVVIHLGTVMKDRYNIENFTLFKHHFIVYRLYIV